MNNEELKKKICEIIAPYVSAWGEDERVADALIAAGIGDVTEWKEKAKKHRVQVLPDGTIKQLYSDEEVEDIARQRDEYKHRAEVAERAVLRACKINAIFAEADVPNILAESALYRFYLQQAEKELAEERNE